MATTIKKAGPKVIELTDGCNCGAVTKFIVTSDGGEFHVERMEIEAAPPADDDFWKE